MNLRFRWLAALVLALASPATGQVAILQIQVIEGEGAVHPPGSRSSRPLTVAVTDETGRPVAGAAVSFHLPEDGPGGAFVNGLRTEVATTDAQGRASVHGLQVNRISGRFQIRITASKEQARAGTVSFQYVADAKGGVASAPGGRAGPAAKGGTAPGARPSAAEAPTAPAAPAAAGTPTAAGPRAPGAPIAATANPAPTATTGQASHGRKKWLAAAALAGGGAVIAILTAGRSGSPAPATVAPAPPALTIGAPSITVGKP